MALSLFQPECSCHWEWFQRQFDDVELCLSTRAEVCLAPERRCLDVSCEPVGTLGTTHRLFHRVLHQAGCCV